MDRHLLGHPRFCPNYENCGHLWAWEERYEQVAAGRARIIEKRSSFNRIHVDDIGTSLIASMLRPNDKRIYNLADGNPVLAAMLQDMHANYYR